MPLAAWCLGLVLVHGHLSLKKKCTIYDIWYTFFYMIYGTHFFLRDKCLCPSAWVGFVFGLSFLAHSQPQGLTPGHLICYIDSNIKKSVAWTKAEESEIWDNVITPTINTPTVITLTLITPTIITPTLNTSTVTDRLCNSVTFSNSNAVRDCPFNLKGAWFLSWSRKFFRMQCYCF